MIIIYQGCVSTAFQFLYRDWFYSTRAEEDAQLQRRNLELVDLLARILRCNYLDKNMLYVMCNLFNPNSIYHQRRTRSGPPSYESGELSSCLLATHYHLKVRDVIHFHFSEMDLQNSYLHKVARTMSSLLKMFTQRFCSHRSREIPLCHWCQRKCCSSRNY
jgi:hypothetical protein